MKNRIKTLKIKTVGYALAILTFGVICFTAGVNTNMLTNADSPANGLPVSHGGTGATEPTQARTNLGINQTATISDQSTDSQYPTAKSVYNFANDVYNFGLGAPIETGTITTTYFDIWYEKYPNKLVKMSFKQPVVKVTIPARPGVIATLKDSLKADFSSGAYPGLDMGFCTGGCASSAFYPLWINCDSATSACNELILTNTVDIVKNTGLQFIVSAPLIYTAV
jgi:hypothetical protein